MLLDDAQFKIDKCHCLGQVRDRTNITPSSVSKSMAFEKTVKKKTSKKLKIKFSLAKRGTYRIRQLCAQPCKVKLIFLKLCLENFS